MFFPDDDLREAYTVMSDGVASVTPLAGGRPSDIRVMWETPTETILGGDAQSDEMRLRCMASELPSARRGDLVVWQGARYRLRRDPEKLIDGRELRLALERV
jgi:hypothetical protein